MNSIAVANPQADYPIEYDKYGRMAYNPMFHTSHGIPFTEEEKEYLCKFYEYDGAKMMSMAIGKTEKVIQKTVYELREKGLFEFYRKLNKYWIA